MSEDPGSEVPVTSRTRASMRTERLVATSVPARSVSRGERDWRTSVLPTYETSVRVLIAVLVGGGGGLILAEGVKAIDGGMAVFFSTVALWAGFLVAVTYAVSVRFAPGLFRIRVADIVWGVGGAALLRVLAGYIDAASGAPFPTLSGPVVPLASWALREGLPAGVLGPALEEFFFRGIVVVALYRSLRPRFGPITAGAASALSSSGSFVLVHAAFAPLRLSDSLQLLALGLTCAIVVLLTGRIWGVILLHMVFNSTFLLLAAVGTILS